MGRKTGVVNVFATPYEDWSKRDTTTEEALDLINNKGLSMIEALQVTERQTYRSGLDAQRSSHPHAPAAC